MRTMIVSKTTERKPFTTVDRRIYQIKMVIVKTEPDHVRSTSPRPLTDLDKLLANSHSDSIVIHCILKAGGHGN